MPKHHKPNYIISLQNLLCIDRCRLRKELNKSCKDCVYVNTLRCQNLKRRFEADRPGDINYYERRSKNDQRKEQ